MAIAGHGEAISCMAHVVRMAVCSRREQTAMRGCAVHAAGLGLMYVLICTMVEGLGFRSTHPRIVSYQIYIKCEYVYIVNRLHSPV